MNVLAPTCAVPADPTRGRAGLGHLPQRALAIYRVDACAVPDIAEMPLLPAVTECRRPKYGDTLPTGLTHTVIGDAPGVLRAELSP
jgi:hypothetical protein